MKEGWSASVHFVLFDQNEVEAFTKQLGVSELLPGFEVVALRGWHNLVVRNGEGELFVTPSVPIDSNLLEAAGQLPDPASLEQDPAVVGRVKWLLTPLLFGGSPVDPGNVHWVDHDQHGQLVRFWNAKYAEVRAPRMTGREDG